MNSDVQIKQRKLTVTLETVTPMFLAGADQKQPELRAPSFIGALRYWTRAALGGVLGGTNLEALKKAEEEIWGSTSGTGKVRLQVLPQDFHSETIKALPHKPSSDPASRTQFEAIPANSKVKVVMRQVGGHAETWQMAVWSLLLTVAYGGVGRRARRGWGTFWIVGADRAEAELPSPLNGLISLPAQKRNAGTLNQELWQAYRMRVVEQALEKAEQLCGVLNLKVRPPQQYPTKFPIMDVQDTGMPSLTHAQIFDTPLQAIEHFGRKEHAFSPGQEFGGVNPRWASPLWVRVLPVSSPKKGYILAMTVLQSEGNYNQANYERLGQFLEGWK